MYRDQQTTTGIMFVYVLTGMQVLVVRYIPPMALLLKLPLLQGWLMIFNSKLAMLMRNSVSLLKVDLTCFLGLVAFGQ